MTAPTTTSPATPQPNAPDTATHRPRLRLNRQIPILLMAVLVGVLGGYGAVAFRFVIKSMQHLFYGQGGDILEFVHVIPPWMLVAMPALGGLVVGCIVYYGAREAKGHGVPEVMEAVVLREGRIRKRVALVKILASAISIGSGGSVGREGPIVQIGSSIGSSVGQLLKVNRFQRKTLVGCGAAAGIAATFNAPVAGVLFALEILLGDFGLTSFSPVVLSSVTATTISRYYFGDFPAFVVPVYEVASLWEFCIYPFLGLVTGLVAIAFTTLLYKGEDLFDALPIHETIKPAIGGALLGLMLLKLPHVFGVGYGAINLSLTNQIGPMLLLALVGAKILATAVTIGSGGSGGVFAPSLFIGAMTGGIFGWCAGQLFPGLVASPGAYALVAMGGLVAGTTHAPITAILIIFELTGSYHIILPLMITCILSTLIASTLKRGSIYTIKLLRRGVDIEGGMEQNILRTLKVRDLMKPTCTTIAEAAPLGEIIRRFKTEDASYLHTVDADGRLTGVISFRDIRSVLDEPDLIPLVIARDVATRHVVTVHPGDTIATAMSLMGERGVSQLPVIDPDHGNALLATLSEKDVIAAYDRAVLHSDVGAE
ncbi:MAG: chloride channel protein [Desulfovibrionaceae bacterium]|jgi:CIC family chloride channel protein|nr:chloride channel protein [Desulfovibrionaceae bacterium]